MAREEQFELFTSHGKDVKCPKPDCVHSEEWGGAALYKTWTGLAGTPPPNNYDVICEEGCNLNHDLLRTPHAIFNEWLTKSIKRMKLAFDYCVSDPDSALTKYRKVGEHTLALVSIFFTNDKLKSEGTAHKIKDRMFQWCKDKENTPTIYFIPHEKPISAFVNTLNQNNQGTHHWDYDPTQNTAQSAKFATNNFVKHVVENVILPPYRPVNLVVGNDSLYFCQNPSCGALLTYIGTTNVEHKLSVPIGDLDIWRTVELNLVCDYCNQ